MSQNHIIGKQVLSVDLVGSEQEGMALQRELSSVAQGAMIEALETVFNESVADDVHVKIDRLDIDVGVVSSGNLEHDFVKAVISAMQIELRKRQRSAGSFSPFSETLKSAASRDTSTLSEVEDVSNDIGGELLDARFEVRSRSETLVDAVLQFLQTGRLPWAFQLPKGQTLEQLIEKSVVENPKTLVMIAEVIRGLLAGSSNARHRFVWQISEPLRLQLLEKLSVPAHRALHSALTELRSVGETTDVLLALETCAWHVALEQLQTDSNPRELTFVTTAIQRVIRNSPSDQRSSILAHLISRWPELAADATVDASAWELTSHENESVADSQLGTEGFYVHNAGAVLLCAFLPMFFTAVGVVTEDGMKSPDRAVALLHFLVTGEINAPEYELTMYKMLCGVAINAPVEKFEEVSTQEREESSALLVAMIKHWDALRSTSIEGLRESFLQRSGKISKLENGEWLVQIESQSFDVLLDRLPWGISMIQLPWMPAMCRVEWFA